MQRIKIPQIFENQAPSAKFRKLCSLKKIEEIYKEEIAWKNIRAIDRLSIHHFEETKEEQFKIIREKCLNSTYNFSPYLEKLALKGRDRRPRVISLPTIRDRIILAILKKYLHDVFSDDVNRILPNTYINKIIKFHKINRDRDISICKADISDFYASIVHGRLLKILATKVKNKPEFILIKKAIENPTIHQNFRKKELKQKANSIGVPQGLAISNILANIYIRKLDDALKIKSSFYIRYVDDIFIAVPTAEIKSIKLSLKRRLKTLGLSLSKDKTRCVLITNEINYLGYRLHLPHVSIMEGTIDRYIRRLSALFSVYANRGPEEMYKNVTAVVGKQLFIYDVNEKITGAISENKCYGWLFYFLEMDDIPLLYSIDRLIRDKFCTRIKRRNWLPDFSKLKSLAKAYYEAKYSRDGGYIENYDIFDSVAKKARLLKHWGFINKDKTYTTNQIERTFKQFKRKRLADLEADLAKVS